MKSMAMTQLTQMTQIPPYCHAPRTPYGMGPSLMTRLAGSSDRDLSPAMGDPKGVMLMKRARHGSSLAAAPAGSSDRVFGVVSGARSY